MRPADLAAAARIRADLKSGTARQQRVAAGFSMADVARAMRPQVTEQAVHYWECGQNRPTVEHALAYGRVLAALTARAALPVRLDWDDRKAAVARLALSQLSYATDTGEERAVIAEMLADLDKASTPPGPGREGAAL